MRVLTFGWSQSDNAFPLALLKEREGKDPGRPQVRLTWGHQCVLTYEPDLPLFL